MSNLQSLFEEGLNAYEAGHYSIAESSFQSCAQQNPLMSEAFLNLGNVFFKQGNLSSAKDQWEKAIAVNPLETKAYLNLGNAFFQEENFGRAIFYWQIFKQLDPYNEQVHLNLGLAYEGIKEIGTAFQEYSLYLSMGKALDNEGIKVRRRMDESIGIAQHNLAVAERAILKGQLEYARDVYAENICLIPLNLKVYKHYAAVLYKLGDYKEAAFWYEKAFSLKEPDMGSLINLGVTCEKMDDRLRMVWAYSMVCRLWVDRAPHKVQERFKSLWEDQGTAFFAKALSDAENAINTKAYDIADTTLSKLFDIAFYCAQNQLAEVKNLQAKIELIRDPGRRAVELTYSRAELFYEKGQLELALAQYESYLDMAPEGEMAGEASHKCEQIKVEIAAASSDKTAPKVNVRMK